MTVLLNLIRKLPKSAKPVRGTCEVLSSGAKVQRYETPNGTAYERVTYPDGSEYLYRIKS